MNRGKIGRSGCVLSHGLWREPGEEGLVWLGAHAPRAACCPMECEQVRQMEAVPDAADEGEQPGEAMGPVVQKGLEAQHLVEQHIVRSLDAGIAAEFEQVKRRTGVSNNTLTAEGLKNLIAPFASVRFGIEILQAHGPVLYRSRNLGDRVIPDQPMKGNMLSVWLQRIIRYPKDDPKGPENMAQRSYNALMGDLGEMRIGEFAMGAFTVRIAVAKEQVRSLVTAYQDVFYILLSLMVIVSSVIGYVLSRILLRPLRQIQLTAAHISSDNPSERIPISSVEDEISDLARLLNQTFSRLESSFDQVQRFAAEAPHELKTPLSLMRLQTEKLLMDGGLDPAQEDSLHAVVEEISRLNKFIDELLFLSRAEANAVTLALKPQDPRDFMDGFLQDAQALADYRNVKLKVNQQGRGIVAIDPRWLRQVLLNLLANALDHTAPDTTVTLTSKFTPLAWCIAIEDEGPGVLPELREKIFGRFMRIEGKAPHDRGSGLGLAISRTILMLHHGKIWAEDTHSGMGLRMVFEIPLAGEPVAPPIETLASEPK